MVSFRGLGGVKIVGVWAVLRFEGFGWYLFFSGLVVFRGLGFRSSRILGCWGCCSRARMESQMENHMAAKLQAVLAGVGPKP